MGIYLLARAFLFSFAWMDSLHTEEKNRSFMNINQCTSEDCGPYLYPPCLECL